MRQRNCTLSYYISVLNIKFRESHTVKERAINNRTPTILKKYEPFQRHNYYFDISECEYHSPEEWIKRYVWGMFKNGEIPS